MTQSMIRFGVIAALAQLVGRRADQISDKDTLSDDLGVDSLIAVNLVRTIEDRLGVPLPEGSESSLVGIWTVGELVERLTLVFANDLKTSGDRARRSC